MPKNTTIITPEDNKTISSLIDLGCWSTVKTFGQSETVTCNLNMILVKSPSKILSENHKLISVNTPLMGGIMPLTLQRQF